MPSDHSLNLTFHSSRLVFNSLLTIPLKETLSCGFLESTATISQTPLIWFSDFPRIWCRNFKEPFPRSSVHRQSSPLGSVIRVDFNTFFRFARDTVIYTTDTVFFIRSVTAQLK